MHRNFIRDVYAMKRFGLAASEEKSFENVDDDGRRTDAGSTTIL